MIESLGLKLKNSIKTIKIGEKDIEVIQYLPVKEKGSLIAITLQQSFDNGIYNPVRKEIFFDMNIVLMYADLGLTQEEKQMDLFDLYDILETNGIINQVIQQIPVSEYNMLLENFKEWEAKLEKYNLSVAGVVSSFIDNLPAQAQAAAEIVDNFDPEKYGEVVNFAKAIGAKI